jgi:hypothetical protein
MRESLLGNPAVVPFVECPNCKQLAEYGAEGCPRCREEIDPGYALVSAVVVHHNTQACSLANTIKGFDPFVYIALAGSVFMYAVDWYAVEGPALSYLVLTWPVIPLAVILVWFYRFGRFEIGDEEYVRARREMRGSCLLWLAILAAQLLALFAVWR